VGINDVDYQTQRYEFVDGKQKNVWKCPYYRKWSAILERCYSEKYHKDKPTYVGCKIHESWLKLSNFIKWVDEQPNRDWQNCEPDKDILSSGDGCYGPDTVAFVSKKVNNFIKTNSKTRGSLMIGVSKPKRSSQYKALCANPFGKTSTQIRGYIGFYRTELEAHKAWQAKKHEYACQLADHEGDPRVAEALRQRYAPDKDWTNV
jgi:hypothetical protein